MRCLHGGARVRDVEEVNTCRVVVTREGDGWMAQAPDLGGCHTWAASVADLDRCIHDAVALVLDLPEGAEESLDLEYE